ncbi:MAG TPA: T9SS type A sorting domain-containing protein [Bacteroidales bacterium]|nr:T9SS type A sorting domain-containing protein [Bacteroidales bacterium]
MKKNYLKTTTFALIFILMAGFTNRISAQDVRYIDVAPGIGTLNEAINGDTTETGARVDTFNTVYRLQRVEDIYYISELIENIDYPLTVVAEDTDGPRPYLALKADENGDNPNYCFRAKGDLTIKGLHLTLLDDLGAVERRTVRASADDITITVDDCWFDDAHQSGFRLDNSGNKLYITNSVFSNIGDPGNPGNGRGIDDRGNDIDTLVIEDCTYYNITSRLLRDGGGHIKYCKINHNTFVNAGGSRGFDFGIIAHLDFTNNIAHNVGYVPQDSSSSRALIMIDAISQDLLDMGLTQTINISNNNWFNDSTLYTQGFLDSMVISQKLNFDEEIWGLVDSIALLESFYYENVNFENPPDDQSILDQIKHQLDDAFLVEDTPDWILPDPPNGIYHLDVPFSFNYSNSVAATGATDGGQLGDRNWTASPDVGIPSVKNSPNTINVYPNPASSYVNIEIEIESSALVQMDVYNMVGKKVYTPVNEIYPTGLHHLNLNLSDKLGAGIYLLKMKAGDKVSTSKMIVK